MNKEIIGENTSNKDFGQNPQAKRIVDSVKYCPVVGERSVGGEA
jgi:hypothetical protein